MKLVIGGATGFVGREVLRQALRCPQITSIVTLGRRAVVVEEQVREKITDIVMMDDGENYSESALEKIADSDACIWYSADLLFGMSSLLIGEKDHWSHDDEIQSSSFRRSKESHSRLHSRSHRRLGKDK
jgi:hypothetical protein